MPRIIHLPISGRDRRFAARELRDALAVYSRKMQEAEAARAAGERMQREADRLFCEAWHAAAFSGQSLQPSPTIAQALGCGFGTIDVRCSRCDHQSSVSIAALDRVPDTPLWTLEASFNCRRCRERTGWRAQAYIVGLRPSESDQPDPSPAATAKAPRR
jgi:hypothetical protein